MNDGASMQSGAWGQVRVREPAGERVLGETLSIGGTGSEVVVPGVDPGAALSVRRLKGLWLVQPAPRAGVRFHRRPLSRGRGPPPARAPPRRPPPGRGRGPPAPP